MTRTARTVLFLVGAAVVAGVFVLAVTGLPRFGGDVHPYRDASVAAALRSMTPNAVSAVVFDQRAVDTLGEIAIVLGSVLGAATLLRLGEDEERGRPAESGGAPPAARVVGLALLPMALVLGADIVAHGHLTPGGGFQGGVVMATGLHLLYIAGRYQVLDRVRPLHWYSYAEAVGTGAFVGLGFAGLLAGREFLANVLPHGQSGALFSAGTVAVASVAVGIEVAAGVVVLLAQFLEQAIAVRGNGRRS